MAKKQVNRHHIFYKTRKDGNKRDSQREIIVPMYRGEHMIVSLVQRLNPNECSKGFWHSLRVLMDAYEPFAKSIE